MWLLYQLLVALALFMAGPVLVARRGRHYLSTLPSRLGRYRGTGGQGALWVHAVSVGEVGVAATLVQALHRTVPLLVTTVTPTGQSRAQVAFKDRGRVTYLPFDLGWPVRRFFDQFSPRALVLVEGDLWPLVLRAAERHRLPVAVINGRISDRSFRRLRRLKPVPPLLKLFFSRVERFGVQSDQDRERLEELGVDRGRIRVTGNLKYETPEPGRLPELEARIRRLAGRRPILIAGSTMAGEEEQVVEAWDRLGGTQTALLVLAPRHPERWDSVYEKLCRGRPGVLRRSTMAPPTTGDDPLGGSPVAVLLLDSLGELATLYRIARGAFIGGTLVPTGGHNPLEAARYGVPVAAGPSMENFPEMAQNFDQARAWRRVTDAASLAVAWQEWIEDPAWGQSLGERARELVRSHGGALEKTLELLAPILSAVEASEAVETRETPRRTSRPEQ